MARIIENLDGKRRIIKLSTNDILSVVREYQRIIKNGFTYNDIYNTLSDNIVFIPEDY